MFNYQGEIVRADVVEHVPPDAGAALKWLSCRKPDDWADTQKHDHGAIAVVTADASEKAKATIEKMLGVSGT